MKMYLVVLIGIVLCALLLYATTLEWPHRLQTCTAVMRAAPERTWTWTVRDGQPVTLPEWVLMDTVRHIACRDGVVIYAEGEPPENT